jgi:glycerol-3-phosphate dehydrogenase
LPAGITITADAAEALTGAALILLVVPAQALRPVLQSLPALLTGTQRTGPRCLRLKTAS